MVPLIARYAGKLKDGTCGMAAIVKGRALETDPSGLVTVTLIVPTVAMFAEAITAVN